MTMYVKAIKRIVRGRRPNCAVSLASILPGSFRAPPTSLRYYTASLYRPLLLTTPLLHHYNAMSSNIMSLSVPQLVNHLKGVVASGGHRLRLRVGANGRRKRCPRISLPRVLAPLPDDISTSLVDEVHHALSALHRTDNDKVSDDAHSSHGSDFTLVGLKSGMQTPMGSEGTAADSNHVSTDLAGKLTDIGELVYSKEDFSASELALFEIKVVPKVVLPQEDYSAAEGLVPLAGYECVLEIQ